MQPAAGPGQGRSLWPRLAAVAGVGVLIVCTVAIVAAAPSFGPGSRTGAPPTPRPTATPRPTRTATPTPTPTPTLAPRYALRRVCDGLPAPGTAPYGGTLHPLVVVDNLQHGPKDINDYIAINQKWLTGEWSYEDIQLVICQDTVNEEEVRIGPCNRTYEDDSGHRIQVIRYQWQDPVRVVVAQTGKTLQTGIVKGNIPECGFMVLTNGGKLNGTFETPAQLNAYATAVSTQAVE